jgi:hypothetical protein
MSETTRALENYNFFLYNIRSLRKHYDDFVTYLNTLDFAPDVIVLTEIWIYEHETKFFDISGYNSFFCTSEESRAGGVAIYVKAQYAAHLHCCESSLGIDWADVRVRVVKNVEVCLLALYRSPSGKIADFIDTTRRIFRNCKLSPKCIFMGDINLDISKPDLDNPTQEYLATMAAEGFMHHDVGITRTAQVIRGDGTLIRTASAIDHVFVRDSHLYRWTSRRLDCGIADHDAVHTCMTLPDLLHMHKPTERPNYIIRKRVNYNGLGTYLQTAGLFEDVSKCQDAELAVGYVVKIISDGMQQNTEILKIPVNSRTRPVKDYITKGIVQSIRTRDKMLKACKRNKNCTPAQWQDALKYRNKLHDIIKLAKSEYAEQSFGSCGNDIRKQFQFINEFLNVSKRKGSVSPAFFDCDTHELCEKFNAYFSEIGTTIASKARDAARGYGPATESERLDVAAMPPIRNITVEEVQAIICQMKNKRSCGYDGIPPEILKLFSDAIAPILAHVFTLCVASGVFPGCLKKAVVVPIYKGGSMSELSNYRPISLLPTISKILEKILVKRITSHLELNHILNGRQFGFREGCGTENALLGFSETALKFLDQGFETLSIFVDLSKAFDTVDHARLADKLDKAGVSGNTLLLIKSFLAGREQCVKLGEEFSGYKPVRQGVPQGSVLGPLLFILYTNDLYSNDFDDAEFFSFADDTSSIVRGKSVTEVYRKASDVCTKLYIWFSQNALQMNQNKTKFIHFRMADKAIPDNCRIQIHDPQCPRHGCSCTALEEVHSVKYLGITVDNRLSFKEHISKVSNKLRTGLFILRKMMNIVGLKFLKTLYYAFVQSHLQYGLPMWGGVYHSSIKRLEIIQNSAIRILATVARLFPPNHNISLNQAYKKLGILPIRKLYATRCILFQLKYPDTFPLEMSRSLRTHVYVQKFHTRTTRAALSYRVHIIKLMNIVPHYYRHKKCSEDIKKHILFSDQDFEQLVRST